MKNQLLPHLFAVCFIALQITQVFAYNNLTISDPRGWKSGKGSIDSATLAIRPKGAFLEHSLYLNFSANTLNFLKTDTMEVVFNFDLPENAIVTDSWLWLNNEVILKGKLLDVWTATGIYEDIVRRRRDPSLLRRISATQYELRIFPMAGTDYRKVKISYLLPATIQDDQMSLGISLPFLQASKVPLSEIQMVYFPTEKHRTPSLYLGAASPAEMWEKSDPAIGRYFYKTVPIKEAINGFGFAISLDKNYNSFYSVYSTGQDHYYQIGLKLDAALDSAQTRRLLIVLDYYSSFSNSLQEVLQALEKALIQNLTQQHQISFLFLQDLSVEQIYPEWEVATVANIQNAIAQLKSRMGNAGSTIQLLNAGLEFVKKTPDPANIFLITGGNSYADWQTANTVIQLLTGKGIDKYPLTIADISTRLASCYWLNNNYFCNNQYLYSNLANITRGSSARLEGGNTVQAFLNQQAGKTRGNILNLDFYTRPEEGFCFNRYLSRSILEYSLGDYVIQVGKYSGTLPFRAELSGLLDGKLFNIRQDIPLENELPSDPGVRQSWAGFHIRELEKNRTNSAISNIIRSSQEFSVLSGYTAFLCLEDTSYFCLNCLDDTKVFTGNDPEQSQDSSELIARPNPFTERVEITFRNAGASFKDQFQLSILDMDGSLVQRIYPTSVEDQIVRFVWEPDPSVPAGLYHCVIQTGTKIHRIRLLKM